MALKTAVKQQISHLLFNIGDIISKVLPECNLRLDLEQWFMCKSYEYDINGEVWSDCDD